MIMPTCRRVEGLWNPVQEIRNLERELSSLFEGGLRPAEEPAVNLWANEEEAVLTAELPGVAPEQVKLTVQGNVLLLEGEREQQAGPGDLRILREERPKRPFARRIRLPYEVENQAVEATLKHGVLTATLPRLARTKPQTIHITTA